MRLWLTVKINISRNKFKAFQGNLSSGISISCEEPYATNTTMIKIVSKISVTCFYVEYKENFP